MQVLWTRRQVGYHDDDGDDVDDAGDENVPCRCPYFIDPASNDLTGRVIEDNQVKELIVQLHNEVSFFPDMQMMVY